MSLSDPSVCIFLALTTYLIDLSLSRNLSPLCELAGESKFKSVSPFNSLTPANKCAAKLACAKRFSSMPLMLVVRDSEITRRREKHRRVKKELIHDEYYDYDGQSDKLLG